MPARLEHHAKHHLSNIKSVIPIMVLDRLITIITLDSQ